MAELIIGITLQTESFQFTFGWKIGHSTIFTRAAVVKPGK